MNFVQYLKLLISFLRPWKSFDATFQVNSC